MNDAHKYSQMWHSCTQNDSDGWPDKDKDLFSAVGDGEWHLSLLIICQDSD